MDKVKQYAPGILVAAGVGAVAILANGLIPYDLIGANVFALLLGMLLNPLVSRYNLFNKGINFVSSKVLRTGIVLMGITLSFAQVLQVGKYALFLMAFTLLTAFGGGYLIGRLFKVNWKLSSLLSVSTAICGGSAVAAVGPTIEAEDRDIAYAISATFIFDIITVIAFPWIGRLLGMNDTSFGLWVGTAVNDTSSVVAAGYGFSDIAGNLAVIVKLTRTLFIVPVVLIFGYINARVSAKQGGTLTKGKVDIKKIFPWFIILFLVMVGIKSTGLVPQVAVTGISSASKLFMIMALGAIGLKTSFKEIKNAGIKPMIVGVIIDTSVVFVALGAQALIGTL